LTLLLDGVDGWLARRTGTASAFGARFDLETDALLIAVLALLLWQAQKAGLWVLGAGALRYVFMGAGYLLPWLRRPLPYSRRRQTVCVVQTAAFIVALSPLVSTRWAALPAGVGLLLLTASFAVDTLWLARRAPHSTAGGPHP
jgi:phosphatidylglycerophosphate synthase